MANEARVETPREFITALDTELLRELGETLRGVLNGHTNNYYNVELKPGATQTVVLVEYARSNGIANFSATSQSAAVAVAAGAIWTTLETGQFTVHHDSSSETGRTLGVTLAG